MAWEGCWYAPCEVVWLLEDYVVAPPRLVPRARSRLAVAKRILANLVQAGLVSLRRFDFESGKQTRISSKDAQSALAKRSTWAVPMLTQPHLRLYPTPKGMRTYESITKANAGAWRAATDHADFKPRSGALPTLAQTVSMVRQCLDCDLSLYSFVRVHSRAYRLLGSRADDPNDRLSYFWRQAGHDAWRVLRWGGGDEERFHRGYLGSWLDALQLSKGEWQELVRARGRPLEADSGYDTW